MMHTNVTLKIAKDLYERAKRLARQRNQDVSDLLAESIRLDASEDGETLYPGFSAGESAVMKREEQAFQQLHPQLREKYPQEYVAIFEGQLVDHDPDLEQILKRTKQQYLGHFVWIAPVQNNSEEIFHFRSPKLVL
jgi:sugar (pentulose or hexulose) kinase